MIISKNSTDENKKLFFLQKKVEAYDQLAEYFYNMLLSIESSTTTLKESQLKLNQLQKDSNSSINDAMKLQKNTLKEVFSEQLFFQRYYSFLSNFHIRYGHIFNFDFDSKVFKKVLDTSNKLAQIASNPVDSFEKNQEKITMTLEAFNKHRIPLQDTLNLLTDEIQEDKK